MNIRQEMSRATSCGEASVRWQRFVVPFAFPVAFARRALDPANPLLAQMLALREPDKRHRALVFLDAGLLQARPELPAALAGYAEAHADVMALAADPIAMPGGEAVKTELAHIEAMQDAIHRLRIDRHSYVVAIGGGALLDAVGLAAATAHRGVRHIRMPTTVLSQNDSGVGVKNAVNLNGVKNYTGTFAPPWAVLNDFDFLEALPRRERIAGVAEAVKVALIRDGDFFRWIEANVGRLARFERDAEEYMIRRCAELHMRQIGEGGDPFETGSARPLDYGHWSAHKLESLTRHAVRHGEAVAIGVALDARYAVLAGLLAPGMDARVAAVLEGLGFSLWRPALAQRDAVLEGLAEFQEHLGGALTITLLGDIGVGVEVDTMDPALVAQAIDWLQAREAA